MKNVIAALFVFSTSASASDLSGLKPLNAFMSPSFNGCENLSIVPGNFSSCQPQTDSLWVCASPNGFAEIICKNNVWGSRFKINFERVVVSRREYKNRWENTFRFEGKPASDTVFLPGYAEISLTVWNHDDSPDEYDGLLLTRKFDGINHWLTGRTTRD